MRRAGSCCCWPRAGTQPLLPPYLLQPGAGSCCCPGRAPHPPLLSSPGSAGWAPPCSAQVPSLPPSHLGRERLTRLRSFPGRPGQGRLFSSWQQVPEAGWNKMQTTKWFVNNFVAISEGFALCCDTGCCYSGEPIAGEGRAVCRKYCSCLLTNSWDIRHLCTAPCAFLTHPLTGSLSLFPFLSFPPLPVVHTHTFLAERTHWRGGFALSAEVRALSTHAASLRSCKLWASYGEKYWRGKQPWQPFAACDSSNQDFTWHRCAWYFTSKCRASHPVFSCVMSFPFICRINGQLFVEKTETASAILSQRLDFDHCWESLHPYSLLWQQWPETGWQWEEKFAVGAGELPIEAACPALSQSCWESLQVLSADPLPSSGKLSKLPPVGITVV